MIEGYKVLKSQIIYTSCICNLKEDVLRLPSGMEAKRIVIMHPGAAVVIPQFNDGRLLLVRQYRHAINSLLLEFPAGTLEKNEEYLDCAKREIIEEVGYAASQWIDLGWLLPTPGLCDEKQRGFIARDLSPQYADCDEDEIIDIVPMTIQEIEKAIIQGNIIDSKTIAFFMKAKLINEI